MIHVIMGLKGSGKTKKMIDAIHETLDHATGDVVCIEYGKKLTYDVNYKVRLVDSEEYGIKNVDMLKGLISGLHAGNFDITHVFIDNLYKTIGNNHDVGEEFIFYHWWIVFATTFGTFFKRNNWPVFIPQIRASPAAGTYSACSPPHPAG